MKSCDTCLLKRREECFGKPEICSDYKQAPVMTEEQKKAWCREKRKRYEGRERIAEYRITPQPVSEDNKQREKKIKQNKSRINIYTKCDKYSGNLDEITEIFPQDVVILGYGESATTYRAGYYKMALVHKRKMRYMEDEVWTTKERAVLWGISEALGRINKPINIILFTSTNLGVASLYKKNGANADLCRKINDHIKEKGCTLSIYVLPHISKKLEEFLKKENREKNFRVLP